MKKSGLKFEEVCLVFRIRPVSVYCVVSVVDNGVDDAEAISSFNLISQNEQRGGVNQDVVFFSLL